MVLKFQKYQTMDTMAQCASNKPPTSCLRPQTDVYPTAGRNQTLEGFYPKPVGSDIPYCRALPSDPVYRIKLGLGCEDISFPSAESAEQGCGAYSKNYTFGSKHNCKHGGKVKRSQYYCVDGPRCKDH
jgi:hypothetical protein